MSNTQAFVTAAKVRALAALVNGKSCKCALYLTSATIGAATASYTTSGEVTGTGYSAGGVACSFEDAAATGTTAAANITGDIDFGTVTLADFNCAMIYDTANGNTIAVYTFGNTSVTAQPFSLTIPADGATALVRIG